MNMAFHKIQTNSSLSNTLVRVCRDGATLLIVNWTC